MLGLILMDFVLQHMSPKTMAALPKSPAGGRRSSSGTGLRPVLPFALDDGSAVDEEDMETGPGGEPPSREFPAGASVDEVEYAYGLVLPSSSPVIDAEISTACKGFDKFGATAAVLVNVDIIT